MSTDGKSAGKAQLLRTGVALGGRQFKVMGAVAREELSQLTDAEIAALYSYLHAMPDAPSGGIRKKGTE